MLKNSFSIILCELHIVKWITNRLYLTEGNNVRFVIWNEIKKITWLFRAIFFVVGQTWKLFKLKKLVIFCNSRFFVGPAIKFLWRLVYELLLNAFIHRFLIPMHLLKSYLCNGSFQKRSICILCLIWSFSYEYCMLSRAYIMLMYGEEWKS